MKKYIGIKVVQAEPMNLIEAEERLQRKIKSGDEEGYFIVYPDGYESWSPKDVFEKSYHETTNLTFGEALVALKSFEKVARKGWNGKDQYVVLIPAGNAMFKGFPMQDCFGLKNTRCEMQPGWIPSVSDCLAEDWEII